MKGNKKKYWIEAKKNQKTMKKSKNWKPNRLKQSKITTNRKQKKFEKCRWEVKKCWRNVKEMLEGSKKIAEM